MYKVLDTVASLSIKVKSNVVSMVRTYLPVTKSGPVSFAQLLVGFVSAPLLFVYTAAVIFKQRSLIPHELEYEFVGAIMLTITDCPSVTAIDVMVD